MWNFRIVKTIPKCAKEAILSLLGFSANSFQAPLKVVRTDLS